MTFHHWSFEYCRCQSCVGRWVAWKLWRSSWRKNWTHRPTKRTSRWARHNVQRNFKHQKSSWLSQFYRTIRCLRAAVQGLSRITWNTSNSTIIYPHCVFLGISAPGSDPELRGTPPGLAEIFQSVTELGAESTGEWLTVFRQCGGAWV